MKFSEEIASSSRNCNYCGHEIKTGSICWREYGYNDWKNICIVCIRKVMKDYLDEINGILKRMSIKRVKNEEQKENPM